MIKVIEMKSIHKELNVSCGRHEFSMEEILQIRTSLLTWYDAKARILPWREFGRSVTDDNTRGYSILVSEVMLQQTQVVTVIEYYNKWMKRWPTTAALSRATLEEVNLAWSGLGYYSRGRRLWEGAKIIENELNGVVPRTVQGLMKLPGVGRYTASAVASIAFGENVGVVDGNVTRVLSRIRTIGATVDAPMVSEWIWKLAKSIVDIERPGDFNQSLMELGATVCTPKRPNCTGCPVRKNCHATSFNGQLPSIDIEDKCNLCLKDDFRHEMGVANFPRKGKKAASREETTLVIALCKDLEGGDKVYAVEQRPNKGLLANLWQLLSVECEHDLDTKGRLRIVDSFLAEKQLQISDLKEKGLVSHIFSHINMKYIVFTANCVAQLGNELEFVSLPNFLLKGTSTAMKKIINFVESSDSNDMRRKSKTREKDPKQRSIEDFLKKKKNE